MKKRIAALCTVSVLVSSCGGGGNGGTVTTVATGLDERPVNATCIAPPRPGSGTGYDSEDVFPQSGRLRSMTKILQAPDDNDTWYVLEQRGTIVRVTEANQTNPPVWLDFSSAVRAAAADGDGRMLGMAFHPDWPATPVVFVYYTGAPAGSFQSVLLRVTLDSIAAPVSPTVETVLAIPQSGPFHKGGDVAFGPDGYLYLGLGDGGGSPAGVSPSQETTSLYGSMLRLDAADTGAGYDIPADNPFFGNDKCTTGSGAEACPEVWAWGLRNPFRWSFDNQGRLFAGDVGRNDWEEINLVERGNNYGWSCKEGTDLTDPAVGGICPGDPPLTDPIHEYPHSIDGASVTAGFVYDGTAIPALQGKFIFSDFVSGTIWAITEVQPGDWDVEELWDSPFQVPALARGNDGEIYIADRGNEKIRRLIATGDTGAPFPDELAATGCVDPGDPTQLSSGVIPYEINAPFWSDAADKQRYFAIPDGETIAISSDPERPDDWDFPNGSVLIKNFRLEGQLIETRLLMKHPDGIWAGYTYEWDDAETTAMRVIGGKTAQKGPLNQDWLYPSESQCLVCHTGAAGFSLGPETAQLNRLGDYPSGNGEAEQITTLDFIGMFSSPLPTPEVLPALPDPFTPDASLDPDDDLNRRARSWLHTNCAGCHRSGGPTQSTMDWRYTVALQDTGTCNVDPAGEDFGIAGAKLLAPGDSAASVALYRMSRRDAAAMPPLGSFIADDEGVALITAWIDSLSSCTPSP